LYLFGYNKLEEKKIRKAMFSLHNLVFPLIFPSFLALSPSLIGSFLHFYPAPGKKILKFLGLYVESFIMGHGSCTYHGHCSCTWRGKAI